MIENKIKEIAHAIKPRECIGLIVESLDSHKIRAITFEGESVNTEDDASIQGRAYIRAKKTNNIIAIFHSHCGIDEKPGVADIAYSEELGIPYYIYSVDTGKFHCYKPSGKKISHTGRPFVTNILDCLTLVQDYIKDETGVSIFPHFIDRSGKWWREGKDLFMDNIPWDIVSKAKDNKLKKYDILLFNMGDENDIVNHCAVCTGKGRMLHHKIYQLSTEEDIAAYMKDLKLIVRLNNPCSIHKE